MSGAPSREGIEEMIKYLDQLSVQDTEIIELTQRIKRDQTRLTAVKEARGTAWRAYCDILDRMDVRSPGNFGFENRLGGLLVEMRRQVTLQLEKEWADKQAPKATT